MKLEKTFDVRGKDSDGHGTVTVNLDIELESHEVAEAFARLEGGELIEFFNVAAELRQPRSEYDNDTWLTRIQDARRDEPLTKLGGELMVAIGASATDQAIAAARIRKAQEAAEKERLRSEEARGELRAGELAKAFGELSPTSKLVFFNGVGRATQVTGARALGDHLRMGNPTKVLTPVGIEAMMQIGGVAREFEDKQIVAAAKKNVAKAQECCVCEAPRPLSPFTSASRAHLNGYYCPNHVPTSDET